MDCQRVPKMIVAQPQMMACGMLTSWCCTEAQIPTRRERHTVVAPPTTHAVNRQVIAVKISIELLKHGIELCREYEQRFGKNHVSRKAIVKMGLVGLTLIPENGSMTPFVQAMPDEFKHDDAVVAYRRYYKSKDNVHYRHT